MTTVIFLFTVLVLTTPSFAAEADTNTQSKVDSFTANTTFTPQDKQKVLEKLPDYEQK